MEKTSKSHTVTHKCAERSSNRLVREAKQSTFSSPFPSAHQPDFVVSQQRTVARSQRDNVDCDRNAHFPENRSGESQEEPHCSWYWHPTWRGRRRREREEEGGALSSLTTTTTPSSTMASSRVEDRRQGGRGRQGEEGQRPRHCTGVPVPVVVLAILLRDHPDDRDTFWTSPDGVARTPVPEVRLAGGVGAQLHPTAHNTKVRRRRTNCRLLVSGQQLLVLDLLLLLLLAHQERLGEEERNCVNQPRSASARAASRVPDCGVLWCQGTIYVSCSTSLHDKPPAPCSVFEGRCHLHGNRHALMTVPRPEPAIPAPLGAAAINTRHVNSKRSRKCDSTCCPEPRRSGGGGGGYGERRRGGGRWVRGWWCRQDVTTMCSSVTPH